MSFAGGVTLDQVLSAVHRYQRHRAGLDLPAWGEAGHSGKPSDQPAGDTGAGPLDAGGQDCDRAADAGDRDPVADTNRGGYDPVAELEAGFAPNEVALALTLTQGGAGYWMDLAVSLTRRLPATLAALGEGTIDLNRARLIGQYTSCGYTYRIPAAEERASIARAAALAWAAFLNAPAEPGSDG